MKTKPKEKKDNLDFDMLRDKWWWFTKICPDCGRQFKNPAGFNIHLGKEQAKAYREWCEENEPHRL